MVLERRRHFAERLELYEQRPPTRYKEQVVRQASFDAAAEG
jgi:hypothetical protein